MSQKLSESLYVWYVKQHVSSTQLTFLVKSTKLHVFFFFSSMAGFGCSSSDKNYILGNTDFRSVVHDSLTLERQKGSFRPISVFVLKFFYLTTKKTCPNFLTFPNVTHIYSIQILEAKTFLPHMLWAVIPRTVDGSHWAITS